jgi:hypothetical protein
MNATNLYLIDPLRKHLLDNRYYIDTKSKIPISDIIVSPFRLRIGSIQHYYFIVDGLIYDITISSHGNTKGTINSDNKVSIIDYPKNWYHFLEKRFRLKIVK